MHCARTVACTPDTPTVQESELLALDLDADLEAAGDFLEAGEGRVTLIDGTVGGCGVLPAGRSGELHADG